MKVNMTIAGMLTLVIVLSAGVCPAQSAKDALRSLQKIQARVESGINYRDYTTALGDALFEVKLFLSSPEAKKKAALAASLSKTMEHYQMASNIWKKSFEDDDCHIPPCGYLKRRFVADVYPELADQAYSLDISVETVMKHAIQVSWKKADKELGTAAALFSRH